MFTRGKCLFRRGKCLQLMQIEHKKGGRMNTTFNIHSKWQKNRKSIRRIAKEKKLSKEKNRINLMSWMVVKSCVRACSIDSSFFSFPAHIVSTSFFFLNIVSTVCREVSTLFYDSFNNTIISNKWIQPGRTQHIDERWQKLKVFVWAGTWLQRYYW